MKKKVVVFGSSGNIGMYLLDYLQDKLNLNNYEIVASGRNQEYPYTFYKGTYIQLDINNAFEFSKLPTDNIEVVIDLAGVVPAYQSDNNPDKYIDTNIKGTLNILNYCRSVGAKIIYMQTWADLNGYLKLEKPLEPYWDYKPIRKGDHAIYCITKIAGMELIKHYHDAFGVKYAVFRLPNIYMYSPSDYYYVDGKKISVSYRLMIDKAINGEDIELWGNPDLGKDIIYIKDLCQMIEKAIHADIDAGIYNAGTGIKTTMREQIEGIIKVFGNKDKKSKIIMCPDKRDCDNFVMDIANIKNDLGYEPQYTYIKYLEDYKKEMVAKRFVLKSERK